MILRNKNILLISPEPWDHIFVSKHHYAIHLARRGNRVFFLGPPGNSESLEATEYENVTLINYRGFPKGMRFFPAMVQRYFITKAFRKLERLCLVRFDVVWSFDNSVFFDFSGLPETVLKISHIVDLNQDFQTGRAARTANVCFCTTELIKARLLEFNSRCYKINHGFNNSLSEGKSISLPGSSAVKVVYAGNLAMPYIDWNVLHIVVRDNPMVDFIFIGPDKHKEHTGEPSKQLVKEAKNVYFPGKVHADDLPLYYKSADLLILAYQEKHHADQANPHKMIEYLGSGKMVVASYTEEHEYLESNMMLMSKRNIDFPARFREALDNLDYWNDVGNMKLRRNRALDNTYDKQIDRIQSILYEK